MKCPYCNTNQKIYSAINSQDCTPSDDDISVCFQCGEVSIFCNNANSLKKISIMDKINIALSNEDVLETAMKTSIKIKKQRAFEEFDNIYRN